MSNVAYIHSYAVKYIFFQIIITSKHITSNIWYIQAWLFVKGSKTYRSYTHIAIYLNKMPNADGGRLCEGVIWECSWTYRGIYMPLKECCKIDTVAGVQSKCNTMILLVLCNEHCGSLFLQVKSAQYVHVYKAIKY